MSASEQNSDRGVGGQAWSNPRRRDADAKSARETQSRDSDFGHDEQEKTGPRLNILAVEDNPEMLTLLKHLLSTRWDVKTAYSMQTAIEQIDSNTFDIVLMDINLGSDETGVDVLNEMRTRPKYEKTPVIAVTAYALPGDREKFLEAGFDAYIGKPFTRQQLFRLMEQVIATLG